jgi:CRISPR/Cas system endoribonuclease Cas6 (RAMP superfamily)
MSEFLSWSEMSSRQQNILTISDVYKEVHGIRPRFLDFSSMSDEDIQSFLNRLFDEAEEQLKSDQFDIELEKIFAEEKEQEKVDPTSEEDKWSEWEDFFDSKYYN